MEGSWLGRGVAKIKVAELLPLKVYTVREIFVYCHLGPGCWKLKMLLVNISLKF